MIVKTEKGVDVRTQNRWNKILRQNAPFLPPEKPKGREKKSCTMLGLDFGTILSISMTYHPWIVWHTWKYYSISKASSNINGILTFWECGVWPLTMTWTFLDESFLFPTRPNTRHKMRLASFDRRRSGRTYVRTDGRTYGRADKPSYRDAKTHLKSMYLMGNERWWRRGRKRWICSDKENGEEGKSSFKRGGQRATRRSKDKNN